MEHRTHLVLHAVVEYPLREGCDGIWQMIESISIIYQHLFNIS